VITASANPPRAAFLNYPLGHTAGRPNDVDEQTDIVRSALDLLHASPAPGHIKPLGHEWPTPWRSKARELSDKRSKRYDTPQYQLEADATAVV